MKKFAVALDLNGSIRVTAESAWLKLKEKYNINFISSRSQCPHIALSAGTLEKKERLLSYLEARSKDYKSFPIKANGLGIFLRETPVIYIRWHNSMLLNNFYQSLHQDLCSNIWTKSSQNTSLYNWLPKSSLAYCDSSYDNLGEVVALLRSFTFDSAMLANTLTILELKKNEELPIASIRFG